MNNNITIESLKRIFYLQGYFSRYCDYLQHRDFEDVKGDRLNRALDIALTDGDGKKYYGSFFGRDYDKNKREYGTYLQHNIKQPMISESQIWASVEEFFDILNDDGAIGELDGLRKHIYSLLEFIKTDNPKNSAETKQMSEDTIIKLIVKHFWKENPIEDIIGDFASPIYYAKDAKLMFLDSDGVLKEDSADRRKKNQRIVRPFSSANEILDKATYDSLISITEDRLIDKRLNEDFKQVISYLKAIKKIRNNQAHHISNTVTEGANKVFEFCLFVYLHLVLTLRQTLILRKKGEYHQQEPAKFRVYIDAPNPSLDVKLFKLVGDNEIEIVYNKEESDSKKLVFDVEYYVNYKLAVSDQRETKTEFAYNSLSPHAYIHAMGEPEIRHCTEDSTTDKTILFEDLLKEMSRTGDNIEDIRETNRAILKKQGEQVEILKREQEDRIKREKATARNLFFLAVFVILAVVLYFAINPSHKESQNILTIDKIADSFIMSGDSLLQIGVKQNDFVKCEQAGKAYRTAITKLKDRAEQLDYNSSIVLCHMYLSGKGCYNLDSAFYYAKKDEVRATKKGQGLYAYLLLKRGEIEKARKEVSRAIDSEEPYIRLTKALYDIHNAIGSTLSFSESKQACESVYQNLSNINNDDANYEKAIIALWGVRTSEDSEFLIHPNLGEAYNALYALAKRNPYALLALGDIHNMMGDVYAGLNYHCAAFYCGVQQEAAISINLSMLFNADTFTLTEQGRAIKEIMAGKANVIGGIGGLLSDYVHYFNNKDYDLAVEAADSLSVLTQETKTNVCINDSTFIPTIQITSRLMTGKPKDFSKAVQLAMKRDNCSDSVAVSDYLKGVCFAKGYGCKIDLSKSDTLILSSAKRGTYTESLVTFVKRHPPVFYPNGTAANWLDFYTNPTLLEKSSKLTCSLMEVALKYAQEDKYARQLVSYLPSYLPKEMLLMNKVASIINNFDLMPITKDIKVFDMINDYICFAMKNGQPYMAQVGCTVYKMFSEKYKMSHGSSAYEMFKYKQRTLPDSIDIRRIDVHQSEYALNINPIPKFPDYAY